MMTYPQNINNVSYATWKTTIFTTVDFIIDTTWYQHNVMSAWFGSSQLVSHVKRKILPNQMC